MDGPTSGTVARVENLFRRARKIARRPFHNIGVQRIAYKELDRDRQEIRVFILSPSQDDEAPIEGRLQSRFLSDVSKPSFQALSYEWGLSESTRNILLNGLPHEITPNLFGALKRIRSRWKNDRRRLTLWIDALCINQNDFKEKAHQIRLMEIIFPRAETVISWLGEPEDAEKADLVGILNSFLDTLRPLMDTNVESGTLSNHWHLRVDSFDQFAPSLEHAWPAIQYLLYGLTYWWRLWILQECTLPERLPILLFGEHKIQSDAIRLSSAMVHCGDQTKAIATFFRPLHNSDRPHFKPHPGFMRSLIHSAPIGTNHRWSLSSLLVWTPLHECKEPRDRIYALRGFLASEVYCAVEWYTEPIQAVYWKALSAALTHDEKFMWDIYSFFALFPRDSPYPSWTLDFTKLTGATSAFISVDMNSSRIQGEKPRIELSATWREFSIHGYEVDIVQSVLHIPLTISLEERYRCIVDYAWHCWFGGATLCLAQQLYDSAMLTSRSEMRYLLYSTLQETLRKVEETPSLWTPEQRQIVHSTAANLELETSASPSELEWVQEKIKTNLERLREDLFVFQTEGGFFGVTNNVCKAGDIVAILPGFHRSMLLRRISNPENGEEGSYNMIGVADVECDIRLTFLSLVTELGRLEDVQRWFHIY